MTNKEADFCVAGASCAGMLEAMIEQGAIPEHHLYHAKQLIADYYVAKRAWENDTIVHLPLKGQA